jgi:hypothetical protein
MKAGLVKGTKKVVEVIALEHRFGQNKGMPTHFKFFKMDRQKAMIF